MLTVMCDAVEHSKRKGRPCVAIRAYRKDFASAGHGNESIDAVMSHLRSGERPKPPTYPEAPVLIQVKSDSRKVIANDVEVYELSVGITSVSLYVDNPDVDLQWMIGKTLHLETARLK